MSVRASLVFPAGFWSEQLTAIWVHLANLGTAPGLQRPSQNSYLHPILRNLTTSETLAAWESKGISAFSRAHVSIYHKIGDIITFQFLSGSLSSLDFSSHHCFKTSSGCEVMILAKCTSRCRQLRAVLNSSICYKWSKLPGRVEVYTSCTGKSCEYISKGNEKNQQQTAEKYR